jgi:glucokinase
MAAGPYFLGVDLGGTRLRVAAVTGDGRLASDVVSAPTGRAFAPDDLRRALLQLTDRVRSALPGGRVAAMGFGTAGVVGRGPLSQCDNLPLLNGIELAGLVGEVVDCPVALENDARCFTLAEARYGAGLGARDVCGITLGTGVGCGVILGGRVHRGAGSQAGEVWRIPLRGRHLEYFLSGDGLVRTYEAAGGSPGLDPADVEGRARDGAEAAARGAWQAFGEDLAFLCTCVIALYDPAVIVIGGSLSGACDLYGPVLASRLDGQATRIAGSELGPAAGVIGAATVSMENLDGGS